MANTIEIKEIMDLIPHRYPFLLVDRILDYEPFKSAVGIKNITFNEPQFQGHFPDNPIMPGVLIIEAMAQTAGIMIAKSLNAEPHSISVLFTSIDNVRFRKPVVPGDTMRMEINVLQNKLGIWVCEAVASVDGKKCTEAKISAMIMNNKK